MPPLVGKTEVGSESEPKLKAEIDRIAIVLGEARERLAGASIDVVARPRRINQRRADFPGPRSFDVAILMSPVPVAHQRCIIDEVGQGSARLHDGIAVRAVVINNKAGRL